MRKYPKDAYEVVSMLSTVGNNSKRSFRVIGSDDKKRNLDPEIKDLD